MRATSTDRSWYWPSPTQRRLSLQLKMQKKAWVRDESTMEERSLCQISQNWTRRWTRSFKPSRSPRKHIAVKVERRASSQRRWRKKVVADLLRVHGPRAQQPARFLRTGTTGDLGRQQRTQVTDSLFLTLHPFLRPFYKAPPPRWPNYDWREKVRNERARLKIWRNVEVLIGWDVCDEAGQ